MQFLRLTLCCLLLPVLFFSCAKKESPSGQSGTSGRAAARPAGPPAASSQANQGSGTIKLEPVHGGETPPPPQQTPTPVTNLTGTDRLLTLRGQGPVLPADFSIGALASREPAGTAEGEAVRVIEGFFSALSKGSVDSKLVLPQWRNDLHRRLSYTVAQGTLPTSVRIGRISFDADRAQAAIRMARAKAWASGEVYLERTGDRWYITDLQANFAQLDRPEVRTQPFDPAEWKALMKE